MKNLFAVSVLIWGFCAVSFAQTNQVAPCPEIFVTSAAREISSGETITFTANIETDKHLKYNWNISAGTIIEGQNSPTIRVSTTFELAGLNIISTVEVKGLSDNCTKFASAVISVNSICDLPEIEDYGKISFREEKARLSMVASIILNNTDKVALFEIYSPEKREKILVKKYIEKVSTYLIQVHKIPKERISFVVFSNTDEQRTRILLTSEDKIKDFIKSTKANVENN